MLKKELKFFSQEIRDLKNQLLRMVGRCKLDPGLKASGFKF